MTSLRVAPLALVFAFLMLPSSAEAWCQMCEDEREKRSGLACVPCDGEGEHILHRRQPCIEYAVERTGSRDLALNVVEGVIQRSVQAWTRTPCPDGRVGVGFQLRRSARPSVCSISQFVTSGGNSNTIAFVDDWQEGRAEFAYTAVWSSPRTGEIWDADIIVNQEHWRFDVCPEEGCENDPSDPQPVVDLENVLTHEFGHFFGIAHTDGTSDATMWKTANAGDTNKRTLTSDDIDAICSIYPEGSLDRMCSFEPFGGFAATCEEERVMRLEGTSGCSAAPSTSGAPLALTALVLLWRRRGPARRD